MWLFKSSIGRKFVMALTGICLVLFVTFHVLMNSVALIWPAAYNQVCEFLGANWYALIASMGLAVIFILHIIYALWLTLQNRAARGEDRYAVNARQPQVEWSSKNMLVLGIVILAFLVVHLIQFWAKMQWQELRHADLSVLPQLEGIPVGPAQGTLFLQLAFKEVYTPIVYIIGFIALWFHMTHGFWSMFQTIGWNASRWLCRLKVIANVWTSVVVLLFVAQAIVFTVHAHNNYYLENKELQEQYAEYWTEQAEELNASFQGNFMEKIAELQEQLQQADPSQRMAIQQQMQAAQEEYIVAEGPAFVEKATAIQNAWEKECSKVQPGETMMQLNQMTNMVNQTIQYSQMQQAINAAQQGQRQAQPQQGEQAGNAASAQDENQSQE